MMKRQHRMTKQRMVILEEIRRVKSHPTAYDVYEMVRLRLPQISLGTVYRNLEHLTASGLIKRLEMVGGQRRFDATIADHIHIRCVSCGRVDDVAINPGSSMITVKDIVSRLSGYDVMGCGMDFHGICPRCRKSGPKGIPSQP